MMDFPQMILENLELRVSEHSLYYFPIPDALRLLKEQCGATFTEDEVDKAISFLKDLIEERENRRTREANAAKQRSPDCR